MPNIECSRFELPNIANSRFGNSGLSMPNIEYLIEVQFKIWPATEILSIQDSETQDLSCRTLNTVFEIWIIKIWPAKY